MVDMEKVITALEFCADTKPVETCFGKCPYAVAVDDYRCGKELDQANMKYVGLSINDYGDDTSDLEHWEFCKECAGIIKRSMIRNSFRQNHPTQHPENPKITPFSFDFAWFMMGA